MKAAYLTPRVVFGERELPFPFDVSETPKSLCFYVTQFAVGDDQEVARSTRRIEDTDSSDPLYELSQCGDIVAGRCQLFA